MNWPRRVEELVRQHRHRRAFRIEPPAWDGRGRERLQRLLIELRAIAPVLPVPDEPAPDVPTPAMDDDVLAEAATQLWRAERKLRAEGAGGTPQSRQARRYLDRCRAALADAELVVQEHDGDPFHPGRSLEVLAFQDDPSVRTETIIQTVRPTVYLRDRRIQIGQVIVGCPITHPAESSEANRGTL